MGRKKERVPNGLVNHRWAAEDRAGGEVTVATPALLENLEDVSPLLSVMQEMYPEVFESLTDTGVRQFMEEMTSALGYAIATHDGSRFHKTAEAWQRTLAFVSGGFNGEGLLSRDEILEQPAYSLEQVREKLGL